LRSPAIDAQIKQTARLLDHLFSQSRISGFPREMGWLYLTSVLGDRQVPLDAAVGNPALKNQTYGATGLKK
jgi:hypothetical protein